MSKPASCIYFGWVTHRRLRPVRLRFAYRVFMFFLDLDELPALDRGGWLFGYNRRALFSFHDRDHGARDRGKLRDWVEAALARAGIFMTPARIRVLCFPRLLGYAFNPLSVIFCYDEAEALRAVLYEVKNTFGEQHTYLFPVSDPAAQQLNQSCAKSFYVSPFMDMTGDYHFQLAPPDSNFNLLIRQTIAAGDQLLATWTGRRQAWSAGVLRQCFWRYPLLTFKVIGAIHWQAVRLVFKGARYYRRPPSPSEDVTIHVEPSSHASSGPDG